MWCYCSLLYYTFDTRVLLFPLFVRICGDTALDKNIHESVSAQIKKNFAKSKWKVSQTSSLFWMSFLSFLYAKYVQYSIVNIQFNTL